jgi:hypothetical protein
MATPRHDQPQWGKTTTSWTTTTPITVLILPLVSFISDLTFSLRLATSLQLFVDGDALVLLRKPQPVTTSLLFSLLPFFFPDTRTPVSPLISFVLFIACTIIFSIVAVRPLRFVYSY